MPASPEAIALEGYADTSNQTACKLVWAGKQHAPCSSSLDLAAALFASLDPCAALHPQKNMIRSARGQPSSISAFVLSLFPFTCSLFGKAAGSLVSWSSLFSWLMHHPHKGPCSQAGGLCWLAAAELVKVQYTSTFPPISTALSTPPSLL